MDKIKIPRRNSFDCTSGTVRLTKEATAALNEVTMETSLSTGKVASLIILQAVRNNLIDFTTADQEEGEL